MLNRHPWRPILTGPVRAAAEAAVQSVVADLTAQPHSALAMHELCDVALLHAYLGQTTSNDEWQDRAVDCANAALDVLTTTDNRSAFLYGGVVGVGWAVNHVQPLCGRDDGAPDDDEDDAARAIDTFVSRRLERRPWTGQYDLISGLVGVGVYCLERLPRASARTSLELVVEHLAERSEEADGEVTWYTPPGDVPNWQRDAFQAGYYNLGVAHGVPGVIGLLAQIAARGIALPVSTRLLEGAVTWLLARGHNGGPPRFGTLYVPGRDLRAGRLGWCYSDLGIAAVLHQAGVTMQRDEWTSYAAALMLDCTKWPSSTDGIRDAGLCHGAAGVAHLFNRVYQVSGEPDYADIAAEWFAHALRFRAPGQGPGGFYAWRADRDPHTYADPGLLGGSAGIALAFLAATTPVEPRWDRLLLLSGAQPEPVTSQPANQLLSETGLGG